MAMLFNWLNSVTTTNMIFNNEKKIIMKSIINADLYLTAADKWRIEFSHHHCKKDSSK